MIMSVNLVLTETESLKRCPRCELWLPLSDFGVCNARVDGLNLYDRVCIREKIAASRQRLREYKAAHPQVPTSQVTFQSGITSRQLARTLRKLKPHEKVREAIRHGAATQREIGATTRLRKDEVCDAIAQLLLWSRDIRSEVIGTVRMYFINELSPAIRRQPVKREARSYGVSSIYSLPGIKF